jgi:hypothetical protein
MISTRDASGIHFQFDNGFIISIQYGWGNYCDNRNKDEVDGLIVIDFETVNSGPHKSSNAEIAIMHEDKDKRFLKTNKLMPFGNDSALGDTVAGWIETEKIFNVIEWVRRLPSTYRQYCDVLESPIRGRTVDDDWRNILWYPKPWDKEMSYIVINQSKNAINYFEDPSQDLLNYHKLKWEV